MTKNEEYMANLLKTYDNYKPQSKSFVTQQFTQGKLEYFSQFFNIFRTS